MKQFLNTRNWIRKQINAFRKLGRKHQVFYSVAILELLIIWVLLAVLIF